MIEHCHTMLDFWISFSPGKSHFQFRQDRNAVKWKINESYVNETVLLSN